MLISVINDYRLWLSFAELVFFGLSLLVSSIYFLVLFFRPRPRVINDPLLMLAAGLMAVAIAIQVILLSVEGEPLMTAIAFVVFCYIMYVHFMPRRNVRRR